MDKFKIGDTVRFKTSDELFKTYRFENRIQRSMRVQIPFCDGEVVFYTTMYFLLEMPFEILNVSSDGSVEGRSSGGPNCIWRVMPKWLAMDDDDNVDFNINEKEILSLI